MSIVVVGRLDLSTSRPGVVLSRLDLVTPTRPTCFCNTLLDGVAKSVICFDNAAATAASQADQSREREISVVL